MIKSIKVTFIGIQHNWYVFCVLEDVIGQSFSVFLCVLRSVDKMCLLLYL